MEEVLTCPVCHVAVKPTDFFCYNCGKNLHGTPPTTSVSSQIALYLGSIFLAPMGIIWGFRYLRQSDSTSRRIGIIAMSLSIISIMIVAKLLMSTYTSALDQVNQIQNLEGF